MRLQPEALDPGRAYNTPQTAAALEYIGWGGATEWQPLLMVV